MYRNRHGIFFLLFISLCSMTFAQSKLPSMSSKPFNKSSFILKVGYEKKLENDYRIEAPKLCLSAGYGFTDGFIAGLYVDFGRSFNSATLFVGEKNEQGDVITVYELKYHSNYLSYGIHTSLHPISLFAPKFYYFDFYAVIRAGMHHFICGVENEWGYDPTHIRSSGSLKNEATIYLAGGAGVAINPSRYFGFFYELAFDNQNKKNDPKTQEMRTTAIHRFGINVRFGGPKKWQK